MNLEIRYFEGATPLKINPLGNMIDVYANKDVFIPYMGQALVPLGFAMKLPLGHIAKLLPRSSTFKTWGVIQTNHVGIIDETYCGDNDQWYFPAIALKDTVIHKNDRICQFEIQKIQPDIEFIEVESLNNEDRGGIGSTGK